MAPISCETSSLGEKIEKEGHAREFWQVPAIPGTVEACALYAAVIRFVIYGDIRAVLGLYTVPEFGNRLPVWERLGRRPTGP